MDGQENTAGAPTVGMPPQGAPQGQPSSTGKKPKIRDPLEQLRSRQQLGAAIVPILVVIIIVVGIIGVLSVLLTHKAVATTTISHVTTTAGQTMQQIQNCMTITKPGEYFLGKPLNVVLSSGACISVKSSNVKLVGNQNKITGSGPFVGTPPYTYGIYIGKVSNVSIQGFTLSSFSYGIYLNSSSNTTLTFNNVTKMAISGIYLNNSNGGVVVNNTVSAVAGQGGGIGIFAGTKNKVSGDVVYSNAQFGLTVNSTGNIFNNDAFNNNPVDISCGGLTPGFVNSNKFSASSCNTNHYCSFAQCSNVNLPANLSGVTLGPNIYTCGKITSPGKYLMLQDINTLGYLNLSNPLSSQEPCIRISAPSVYLNCNGHSISNSGYGINASYEFNTTIANCRVTNSSNAGIFASTNYNLKLINDTVTKSTYGIRLTNNTAGEVLNTTATSNRYGIAFNGTGALSIINLVSTNNSYGTYVASTSGLTFNIGKLRNNSLSDMYCTANTYNGTQNQFQGISCGTSDCTWAAGQCAYRQKAPVALFPVGTCYSIVQPGNYSLNSNLVGSDKCITINASNVTFNCNKLEIFGNGFGTAILIANSVRNVQVSNCVIAKYQYGIVSSNAQGVTLENNVVQAPFVGISLSNDTASIISRNNVSSASGSSFVFNRLSNSTVNGNVGYAGVNKTTGGAFSLNNSNNNVFTFNNATGNGGYGFAITNSANNNIFNNSAATNSGLDYYCSAAGVGLYANKGEINFGTSKGSCRWLVELNPVLQQQSCLAISTTETITFHEDMVYRTGQTCFSTYNKPFITRTNESNLPGTSANDTVINCNYHTVLATNGGTFLRIINSSSVSLINCYIKNFTNPVIVANYTPIIENDTISDTSNTAIGIYGSTSPLVNRVRILNATSYGINLVASRQGRIYNNTIINAQNAISVSGGTGFTFMNNTANIGSLGLQLYNTTIDTLQNNRLLNMSNFGIVCGMNSQGQSTSLNRDLGGNVCSSNGACNWMTSSSYCAPH